MLVFGEDRWQMFGNVLRALGCKKTKRKKGIVFFPGQLNSRNTNLPKRMMWGER
jgi:hypothetical protein